MATRRVRYSPLATDEDDYIGDRNRPFDPRFDYTPKALDKVPWKSIALALFLLFLGTGLLFLSYFIFTGHMGGEKSQAYGLLALGFLSFLPGFYETRTFYRDTRRESQSNKHPSMATTKVYIVYYSTYGHVEKLAEEIKKGAGSVEGVEAKLWQVPETLSEEVLGKMGAPPKSDVPIITPNELPEADGLLLGFPTRFGLMAAQFKAFMDATGGLWRTQALAGKPAGIFYSTGSQGGGQETTPLTSITQLVHHGMIFVPIGYTFGAGMFEMENVKGGSPYGAGTYAGDGSRQPTELELAQAFHQGKYFAGIAKKLKGSSQ